MIAELNLKRVDGTRINLKCIFNYNHLGFNYKVYLSISEPKKRSFLRLDVSDNYIYRGLPFNGEERALFELKEMLKYVTIEELNSVKLMCWNELKPKLNN